MTGVQTCALPICAKDFGKPLYVFASSFKFYNWFPFTQSDIQSLIKEYIKESDDKRSLSNMASFLFRNNIINEEEYSCIKKVIEIRNIVIHRLFIDDEYNKIDKLKEMKKSIENALNIFKMKYL